MSKSVQIEGGWNQAFRGLVVECTFRASISFSMWPPLGIFGPECNKLWVLWHISTVIHCYIYQPNSFLSLFPLNVSYKYLFYTNCCICLLCTGKDVNVSTFNVMLFLGIIQQQIRDLLNNLHVPDLSVLSSPEKMSLRGKTTPPSKTHSSPSTPLWAIYS